MAINKEHIAAGYANSNGYFKDPGTGEWLTGLEPRSVKATITESGSLIWPEVKASTGESIRLVYKCWTAEEKALYKQYREGNKTRPKAQKKSRVQEATVKPISSTIVDPNDETKVIKVTHSQEESVVSIKTAKVIAEADSTLGVWLFEGIPYDLLHKKGQNGYTPIPRVLISDEDRVRLHIA